MLMLDVKPMVSNKTEMETLNQLLKPTADKHYTKKSLFIFGISGFCGKRIARYCASELSDEFVEVSGTVRAQSEPQPQGYTEFRVGDDGCLSTEALAALQRATHVLSTVPTTTDNTLDDEVIQLRAKRGGLVWAGYLSTTAVYGDRGGSLASEDDDIDESTLSERGRARFNVEERWRRTGAPIHIFRLPGIYGPGRGPLAKAREPSNRLLLKENQVFCRIHVDDIVQALVLSVRSPNPGRTYNVCDEEPASSHAVSLYAYSLLNKQPPPLTRYEDVETDLSPMVKSFYNECKRVSNGRIGAELGFVPLYPTYREGLVAQMHEENSTNVQVIPVSSSLPVKKFASKRTSVRSPKILSTFHRIQAMIGSLTGILRTWLVRLRLWLIFRVLGCTVILVDNGSVRPGATLGMRRLAVKLMAKLGTKVVATSWRYADRIDKTQLNGTAAVLLAKALQETKARYVVVLPLFLGPSAIVTKEIPKLLTKPNEYVAPLLVNVEANDCEISNLLERAAFEAMDARYINRKTRILLVDHGSPNEQVTRIRRALAARLRARMYPATVVDCSMERREGTEYDFNEPTLENAFKLGGFDSGEVIVVPAFLYPGNHAGPGGDIANIIARAVETHPGLVVKMGGLLMDESNDDIVLQVLSSRVRSALL